MPGATEMLAQPVLRQSVCWRHSAGHGWYLKREISIRHLPQVPLEDGVERNKLAADIFLIPISQRRDPNPDMVWGRSRWGSKMLGREHQNVPR